MMLKDLTSIKDLFSYRQKICLLIITGVIVGLGALFMYLLRAHTYFIGDNPAACVNCHIMTPYYATWSHSSHSRNATCNDCHVPHQNIAMKYGFKAMDGMKHTAYFVAHAERQAIMAESMSAEQELAKAHFEAKFIIDNGATDAELKPIQELLRKSQWRWDYAIASHGATFHAPQEVTRLLSHSVDYAQQARLLITKVAARHGHIGDIPVPDYSTKAKAQTAIGLDMKTLKDKKQRFLNEIVPKWIDNAKKNGKLIEI